METPAHEDPNLGRRQIPTPSPVTRASGGARSAAREIVRRRREAERKLLKHLLHEQAAAPSPGTRQLRTPQRPARPRTARVRGAKVFATSSGDARVVS